MVEENKNSLIFSISRAGQVYFYFIHAFNPPGKKYVSAKPEYMYDPEATRNIGFCSLLSSEADLVLLQHPR